MSEAIKKVTVEGNNNYIYDLNPEVFHDIIKNLVKSLHVIIASTSSRYSLSDTLIFDLRHISQNTEMESPILYLAHGGHLDVKLVTMFVNRLEKSNFRYVLENPSQPTNCLSRTEVDICKLKVSSSDMVLVFLNSRTFENDNVKIQLEYAQKLDKPIVFVSLTDSFVREGKLLNQRSKIEMIKFFCYSTSIFTVSEANGAF